MSITKPVNWGWLSALQPFFDSEVWTNLEARLRSEKEAGKKIYPPEWDIFDAFNYFSPEKTKVVIIGAEPYAIAKQATGLAFSVRDSNPKLYPTTIKNILRTVEADIGSKCITGYLGGWAFQGVLLLNSSLTVEDGKPGSHKDWGWELLIHHVLNYLSMTSQPIVYMLWGEEAQRYRDSLTDNPHQLVLETSHPSPLTVHNGFVFCKHFSKANSFLRACGKMPIDWRTG